MRYLLAAALCMTFLVSVRYAEGSDGTAGKPWLEQFRVCARDGAGRTNTESGLFGAVIFKDFAPYTSVVPVYRNFSTQSGDHGFTVTPDVPGYYTLFLDYSGFPLGTFYKTVREHDPDTAYAGLDGHMDAQDAAIGKPLQSNFSGIYTSARAWYLDRLDADVSSRAVFSEVSGLHARTDSLIAGIDDDPWDEGVRSLTAPVDISFGSVTGIDSFLCARHGNGVWDATGSVSVIPFQGTVSYETASYGADVHAVRGDSVAIPYTIGQDITGWTVHFGAKANPSDDIYAVGPKDVTVYVTDPSTGSGLITLDTAETSVQPRRYFAELEIRNGPSVNTVLRFRLWVDPDIIR